MSIQYERIVQVQIAGFMLEDIRIDGELESTQDDQQTTGELTLYNLKRSTSEQIREKGQRVIIDAGYRHAGGASRLYEGVVQRVWKTRGDTSFQTKIQLGDEAHSTDVRGGVSEHTFEGEVATRTIAQSMASDMGIQLGPLDAIPVDDTRTNFRASGKTIDAMRKLVAGTEGLGFGIDIVGVGRFTAGASSQPDGIRITVSPKTGLVGIPDIEEDAEEGRRISITMLLNPKARTGGEVVVEGSEFIEPAPLTIVGVNHVFSNWTGKFLSMLDCVTKDFKADSGDR